MKESETDPDLKILMEEIYEILGFKADHYEIKHLKRRLQSRLRVTGCKDYLTYLERLKKDHIEIENLKKALTVNVTEFFRNPEVFEIFEKKVVPDLLDGRLKYKPLRIWSLGCSTGEEPYTIAMVLADVLGVKYVPSKVKIIATDIDEGALEIAKKRTYPNRSDIPEKYWNYIDEKENGGFSFTRRIRDVVSFRKHDVFSNLPLRNIDIIFCRNTIIYFNAESKKKIYSLFNKSLIKEGFLVLGKSETFVRHRNYGFESFERRSHIFKKKKEIKDSEVDLVKSGTVRALNTGRS